MWEDITLGPCRLICGDAAQVLPTLAEASVHLIVVDPPYFRTKLSWTDTLWSPLRNSDGQREG